MAQEVLKACTGKFTPLKQWLYFDAQEAVPIIDAPAADEFQPLGTRYDRQIAVLGRTLHKRTLSPAWSGRSSRVSRSAGWATESWGRGPVSRRSMT